MGIVKKKDAQTYSTQIVKSKELTQCANPNLAQSLIGKVSGLQINTTENSVNPTSRIIIRGNRSISGNNEALIVIDNVISTTDIFTALAPETVDSIYVIKGVQGAALYGAYGANGVIMVRTKEGCDEDISVELDSINNEVITNQLKDQNNINTTGTYKIEVSNQNISETLVEKVKGLQISKTNNGINPTSRIVFRCGRSLADDKEALIVIDDKIATTKEFQKLDTNLIDNVKIIKGEQATALYGVKGSNGVIVVKTKQQFYE
jgi:TonB-dependent SusC/RagA subfamily outer membrane receptor